MHGRTRLLGLLACLMLGAGCGGTSSTATTSAPPSPSALFVTAAAQDLILQPDDVGSGWFAIPKDTHTVSLAESEKGDSVSLRKVEQASYRSGYQGLYADGRNDGVLVGAFTYSNPAVALQVADSWSAQSAAQIVHATLMHPPSSVVGGRVSAWRGEIRQRRAMVPVYTIMWSHGNAIGGVFLFGHKASAGQAYRIAAAQDARLTAA
jgi:hypothetical protein